jgi:hypothetical protein
LAFQRSAVASFGADEIIQSKLGPGIHQPSLRAIETSLHCHFGYPGGIDEVAGVSISRSEVVQGNGAGWKTANSLLIN